MLVMTFLVLASILIISLSLGAIVVNSLKIGATQVHSTKAFFAAEAGAERILWEIRKNNIDPGEGAGGDFCGVGPSYFCFFNNTDGTLNACNDPCPVGKFKKQQLSNNSTYNIKFEYNAAETILTSYGSFEDVNRVIELKY